MITPIRLAALEAAYDGPPPWQVVETILLGGAVRHRRLGRLASDRRQSGLAADARDAVARRRRELATADAAAVDAWLARLVTTLSLHRNAAVAAFPAAEIGIERQIYP
ncbi:MAG: hypothetical protein GC191_14420 [Azospirillum sp.]|nr:hypothetical protein [Azospirillum sp.]